MPILPGRGIAGLQIGQSESTIKKTLGEPTKGPTVVRFANGSPAHINYQYKNGSATLIIFVSPDKRRIFSFRYTDPEFNSSGYAPQLPNGVTIGATRESLLIRMGQPKKTKPGGYAGFGENEQQTEYGYNGISFLLGKGKIGMLDIPGI